MKNWSVDTKELKKDQKTFEVWRLEQLINYGLDGEKINRDKLQEYWGVLQIDPQKKKFLSSLL